MARPLFRIPAFLLRWRARAQKSQTGASGKAARKQNWFNLLTEEKWGDFSENTEE